MVLTMHNSHHTSMNFCGGQDTRMSLIFFQLSFHVWLTSFLFRPLFTLCFRHSTLLSSTSALPPPAFVNIYVCIYVKPVNKGLIGSVALVCSLTAAVQCCSSMENLVPPGLTHMHGHNRHAGTIPIAESLPKFPACQAEKSRRPPGGPH